MVEFLISGQVVIGTVLSPVPISGSIVTTPPAYIGTIAYLGTLGTVLSPVPVVGTVSVVGTIVASFPGTLVIATIDNAPLITVQGMVTVPLVGVVGTVGTVQSLANLAVASLVGSIGSPIEVGGGALDEVGTIGTILSPVAVTGTVAVTAFSGTVAIGTIEANVEVATVAVMGTLGTVLSQVGAAIQQQFAGTRILSNVTVTTSGAATLVMGSLQDLVVDYVFGTAVAGSVLAYVADVEEQTGFQTGTNVSPTGAGAWFAGTVQGGHRLVVAGATGFMVAVGWLMASGGTVGVGTVTNVYVTARPVEGP